MNRSVHRHFSLRLVVALALLGSGMACSQPDSNGRTEFGELTVLADKYGTDKGSKFHNYTDVYEYFLAPMKYSARKIFEIGVRTGASMQMFRDYFPNAVIYGIDIKDKPLMNSDRTRIFVADQADREQLQAFIDAHGRDFELILDDGGHTMEQQQVSFGFLFQFVKPGGFYIIEDVNTSVYDLYGTKFGVDKDESNSTLVMINDFIRGRPMRSRYLTPEEEAYLEANIEYSNLLSMSESNGKSIVGIFKKREQKAVQ